MILIDKSLQKGKLVYAGGMLSRLFNRLINTVVVIGLILVPVYLFSLALQYDSLTYPSFVVLCIPFIAGLLGLYGVFNIDSLNSLKGATVGANQEAVIRVLKNKYPGIILDVKSAVILGEWRKSWLTKKKVVVLFQGSMIFLNIRALGLTRYLDWSESVTSVLFQEDECREIASRVKKVISQMSS